MTEFEYLKRKNPGLELYPVQSPEFREYGKVITDMDSFAVAKAAEEICMPPKGTVYHASDPAFEALEIAKIIRDEVFGTLETQLGYCYGFNSCLNAAEWHCSSELNIAITPLVLILGKRSDLENGRMNSSVMKAFYLPAGTVAEIYATSLHFCPCQTGEEGFRCVVGLPKGTNLPLEAPTDDKLLFRRNKWIVAHDDNEELIARGVVPGICGDNYRIIF